MAAGGALGLLANLGEQQGWSEGLVKSLQVASATLTGLGSVLAIMPLLFGNIKVAANGAGIALMKAGVEGGAGGAIASIGWGPFLLIIGAVIVTVIALVAAFKAIHAASPEGKLEAATEAATTSGRVPGNSNGRNNGKNAETESNSELPVVAIIAAAAVVIALIAAFVILKMNANKKRGN